jgi:hypothetical protein
MVTDEAGNVVVGVKLLLWDKSRKIGSENLMVEFEFPSPFIPSHAV